MSYYSKFLPWILLTGIVSVFGSGLNSGFTTNYLLNDLPSGNALLTDLFPEAPSFGINNETSKTSYQTIPSHNNAVEPQSTHLPSTLDIFLAESSQPESSNPSSSITIDGGRFIPFSPSLIVDSSDILDSSGHTVVGINGTGGATTTGKEVAGIDGTGGPDRDIAGIDGTGGTGSSNGETAGIDGTGGPGKDGTTLIGKSTVSYGTMTQSHGGLVVNGIRFEINGSTEVIVDGVATTGVADLGDGQIVKVTGTINESNTEGVAQRIVYITQISGQITRIEEDFIVVLGQTIELHEDIIFGGTAKVFSDLQVGDMVNISGFRKSNNHLAATRIDRIDNADEDKLTGTIDQLDEENKTFAIDRLTVNYSQVTSLPLLMNGQTLNIQGTVVSDQGQTTFIASSVEVQKTVLDNAVERIELEGFITEFANYRDFVVNGVRISASISGTEFIGGEYTELQLDTKIEVEGTIDQDNVFRAEKVKFLVAKVTSHKAWDYISSSTETFTWQDVGATSYRVVVRSDNLMDNQTVVFDEVFDGKTTSIEVSNLPETTSHFMVQLYTHHGTIVSRRDLDLRGSGQIPESQLTSHIEGQILTSRTETFTWSEVPEAEAYRIQVRDANDYQTHYVTEKVGESELQLWKEFTEPVDLVVDGLPNNAANIRVAIWIKHNGWWSRTLTNITSLKEVTNSRLTSHRSGQKLSGATETFTWEDVGAEKYKIQILIGQPDLKFAEFDAQEFTGDITSYTVKNIPDKDIDLKVKLYTKHVNANWGGEQTYYLRGSGNTFGATLKSHENGQVLLSDTQTFTWDTLDSAEEYYLLIRNLYVDSTPKFSKRYDSFSQSDELSISQELNELPKNNAKLYMVLSTKENGFWSVSRYIFQGSGEQPDAEVTSHFDGQIINTASTTFTWNDVSADEYHLKVFDAKKTYHKQTYGSDTLSVNVDNLPRNTQVTVSLFTNHGGWWAHRFIRLNIE